MARLTTPLTDKTIQSLKPKDKTYRLFDGGGLYLEVSTKGQKWWRLKYRINSKEKRISLGVYPATSLSDARKQREAYKEKIAKGIDPSQERKDEKANQKIEEAKEKHTFEWLTDEYFKNEAMINKKLSEDYLATLKRRVEKHCYPTLKSMNVNSITRADVKAIFTKLKSNGHNELGRRIFLQIRSILAFGVYEEIIEHNIGADFDAKKEFGERSDNHHPVITDKKKLKDLLFLLDNYFGDFTVRQALRVMPYLAFRPVNIRFLEWGEVDFEKKTITIPANKMKMKIDYKCPISPTVIKILEETKMLTGDDQYVFRSSVYTKRPLSASTLNVALRKLGYGKDQIVSHSFRGIFSTIAHDNLKVHKCSSLAIEKQLAHKDMNKSRDSYNASDLLDERVELMEWWDKYLDEVKRG